MIDAIRRFFVAHAIEPCHLLVACSGGVDSTALLLALAELRPEGWRLTAGHVNHRLRGEESDGDEAFVRGLCEQARLPLEVADGALDPDTIREVGLEAAARDVRHARLSAIAAAVGARFVATAHQKNDQAETVLMRLICGTGLAGLRGIHPVRDDGWIRPLIDVSRRDIEAFLQSKGVTPRTDRMNADPRFLRNRVRSALAAFEPAATENLAAIATQAQQVWPAIEETLDALDRTGTRPGADETRFVRWPDEAWWRQALLLRHIRRLGSARDVSATDLQRIVASLDSVQRLSVTRDLELVRRRGALVLRKMPQPVANFEVAIAAPASIFVPETGVRVTVVPSVARDVRRPDDRTTQLIQLPLPAEPRFIIRNRRRGDRFQPLGMPRDKKLKDFLIDRKIDAELRDAIPLLIWNGEIAWVGGVEVSERFKVTSPTEAVYEVKLEHASQDRNPDVI